MIIDRISTRAFAKHNAVDVDLPRTGVVVITGKNGHGKSSLVEAVAAGGWNETLRGAPGWRKGEKSGVELHFDGGHITRSVSSSKHVLRWMIDDEGPSDPQGAAEFATRTKSQEALESRIGTFHVWKHACTFHTDDVARFTRATDAERKRLLEEVLELDRVERGYRQARETATAERRVLSELQLAHERLRLNIGSLESQLAFLDGELELVPDIDAMRVRSSEIKAELAEAEGKLSAAAQVVEDARVHKMSVEQEAGRLHQRVQRISQLGPQCSACEQSIGDEYKECQLKEAHAERQRFADEVEIAKLELSAAREDQLNLAQVVQQLRDAHQTCVREGREAVAAQQRNAERLSKHANLIQAKDQEMARAVELRLQLEAQDVKVRELDAAVIALSFQGVRAALLDGAVLALQDLARDWLGRLGLNNISVDLTSQTQAKTGRVSDKISFEVTGAGGGYGYKGCSTGERRRIDIAMMLAIGELAAGSRGVSPNSTLFIDEVFDGLDEEGREAAVLMLNEISQERCVVVITHNAELLARLTASVWLNAVDGELRQEGT